MPGPSLSSAVTHNGPLPLPTVLQLVGGIAEALQTIHAAGVIHRDLKPSNVLLASDGPRVIDFGIARAADTTALTGSDVRLGTPAYMAPEQAMGGDVTPALDVFALGLVAYYAATRRHPFGDGTSHALLYRIVSNEPDLSACPEPLRGLIGACLAKDPASRPTPEQVVGACAQLAGTGGLARQEGWWLPPAVAEQIAEQERTVRLLSGTGGASGFGGPPAPAPAASPPQGPVPVTQPGLAPGDAYAAAAPTRPGHSPGAFSQASFAASPTQPAQSPTTPTAQRRRTPLVVALAVVGVLAVGGGSFAAYKLMGDDSGDSGNSASGDRSGSGSKQGGSDPSRDGKEETAPGAGGQAPKTAAGWQVSAQNKNLVLRAPKFYPNAKDVGSDTLCQPSDVTTLDINDLDVTINDSRAPGSGPWLSYTDCPDPISRNGIRLADPSGAFGITTERRPTPGQCRGTAQEGSLPNPIPLSKIRDDSVLKAGTGICIESTDGPLTHLWITKVNKEPENDNLRTYVVTATQWKPE
ncbi:serine/threonine-protein kinase [Streptomyces sp. NPDC041068]|uniref:serine/threonine-protein kinase n=1 Tax=Streptomyces sp. NPDC041068 TaxID=3155130 RepID=UPI00340146B4